MISSKIFVEKDYDYVYMAIMPDNSAYVGQKVGNDSFYGGSSESLTVKDAIDKGDAKIAVLWKGKDPLIRDALETYVIRLGKNKNVFMHNKNGGGSSDARSLPTDVIINAQNAFDRAFEEVTLLDGSKYSRISQKNEELRSLVLGKNVEGLLSIGVRVEKVHIDKLVVMPKKQVRTENELPDHIDQIADLQKNQTIEETLARVDLICIVEYPDGKRFVCNGTHTIGGTKKGGKLISLDCAIIPFSYFENSENAIRIFGTMMNRPLDGKIHINTSPKQCRPTLRDFYYNDEEMQKLFESDLTGFVEEFIKAYGGEFGEDTIERAVKSFKDELDDLNKRGKNWMNYGSKSEGGLKDNIKSEVFKRFGATSVCSIIEGGSIDRQVISNSIMHFSMAAHYQDTWIGLVEYKTAKSYETRNKLFESLERQMFYPLAWHKSPEHEMFGKVPYLTHDGKKIFILELPTEFNVEQEDLHVKITDHMLGQ